MTGLYHGSHLFPLRDLKTADDLQAATEHALYRALSIGHVIGFVGSGMSVDFGYPSWKTLADEILTEVRKDKDLSPNTVEAALLGSPGAKWNDDPNTIGTILDFCQRLYARRNKRKAFDKLVTKVMRKPESRKAGTPIDAVIRDLGIRRFVTTNYDDVLVQRLDKLDPAQQPWGARRLDRRTATMAQLVAFAMAADSGRTGVLHLHGSLALTDEHIVLTESQYQREYTSESREVRATREIMRLIYASNALLFVGFGMRDDDVLRPFRQFVSDHNIAARHQPWFAIVPLEGKNPDGNGDLEYYHRLYYRYGIRALFAYYDRGADAEDTAKSKSAAVRNRVECLRKGWLEYRSSRLHVPKARLASFQSATQPMVAHHAPVYANEVQTNRLSIRNEFVELVWPSSHSEAIRAGQHARLLLGSSGSGRGSTGFYLAKHEVPGDKTISFFATTHFSNDFLSQLDRAYFHLTANKAPKSPELGPVERFFAALAGIEAHCVFVFGGIERLLRPIPYDSAAKSRIRLPHDAIAGRPVTPEIANFLERTLAFAREATAGKSAVTYRFEKHIFLTSALLPDTFIDALADPLQQNTASPILRMRRLPVSLTNPATAAQELADLPSLRRAASESLYLRDVLVERLKGAIRNRSARMRCLQTIELEIGRSHPNRHPERALGHLVDYLGLPNGQFPQLRTILETLSLFTTPVPANVLAVALSALEMSDLVGDIADKLLRIEQESGLVLKFAETQTDPVRFTTHTALRTAMLSRLGTSLDRPAEIHQFGAHDFISEPDDVQPLSADGMNKSLRIFDALADASVSQPSEGTRAFIRAAFGVLRSSWSATGLGRMLSEPVTDGTPLPIYQSYHRRLARLLNLVMAEYPQLHPNLRLDEEPGEHTSASLYRDELFWLYNELGLVCYAEGALLDSRGFLDLADKLAGDIEQAGPGYRMVETTINRAMVLIDRARFEQAREILERAASIVGPETPVSAERLARIEGLLGLICHLRGDHDRAIQLYDSSITALRKAESRRGISIFCRHRSDLKRKLGRLPEARLDLDAAIAAAEAGFHPDLVHFCRISDANLRRSEARSDPSKRVIAGEMEPTLRFARHLGSAKLESDAYRIRTFIEMDQEDYIGATHSALECLAISRAYHLRLRTIASIELLAEVMQKRNEIGEARNLFDIALGLARRFQYPSTMEAAERALARLGDHRKPAPSGP